LGEYRPQDLETRIQQEWEDTGAFKVTEDPAREKFYCLSMFPYPSGRLHMGHVRNYTIGDVITRYQRMCGRNVLQPMGWDAFGLPAENAAMQNAVPPAQWTYDNIAYMRRQLRSLGLAIDWRRELATCRPEYYRWNQWLFLRMLERGIVYRKVGTVNWDPVDQTVLANEQVIDGRGWRTGAVVEKREIPMYYMAITNYADELLADLDSLTEWPEQVRLMQKNWIGKSHGVRVGFPHDIAEGGVLWVFTTRADTLMGATYVAVAAEHPLAMYAAKENAELTAFIDECRRGGVTEAEIATQEKKGMATGLYVTHPLSGERLPLWVANYVLMGYGEGAVMAVPAHDERDFEFATKYQLPIKPVIRTAAGDATPAPWQAVYAEHGSCINSGKYDGLNFEQAVDAIAADLSAKDLGEKRVTWRLRDWGISRQRYWGTPIPMIKCPSCGDVPVPDEQLPVALPEGLVPDGSGNPLAKYAEFLNCVCPKCGGAAQRETDTMDTFVDSSWYFFRYASYDGKTMVDERAEYWMPVDQYIGGIEHAILHLLYSRFWTKVMRDLGLTRVSEPFEKLLTQGMVLNHIFSRKDSAAGISYFSPDELDIKRDEQGKIIAAKTRSDGQAVDYDGIGTMSKSKRNGVDPQDLVGRYGADTVRLFMMFAAPPEMTLEWSDAGVEGASRFVRRLWNFAGACVEAGVVTTGHKGRRDAGQALPAYLSEVRGEIHALLRQAQFDFNKYQFNTVVAAGMKMLNVLYKIPQMKGLSQQSIDGPYLREAEAAELEVVSESLGILLRILAPIIPHVVQHLWRDLGYGADILDSGWPEVDESALLRAVVELVVQVNGKLRGRISVAADADRKQIEAAATGDENVARFISGKVVRKIIIVPGKLVNVVAIEGK